MQELEWGSQIMRTLSCS